MFTKEVAQFSTGSSVRLSSGGGGGWDDLRVCLFVLNRLCFLYLQKKSRRKYRVLIYPGTHFSLLVTFYINTLHLLRLMKQHGYIITNQTLLYIYISIIFTSWAFSVSGSHPGYHIMISSYVSLGLSCDIFSDFILYVLDGSEAHSSVML